MVQVKDSYLITPETLIKAKQTMIVMHPLPRVNEIRWEYDLLFKCNYRLDYFCVENVYFTNSLFTRMT